MKVQPVVEGRGEAEAVCVLLRRLRDESALYGLDFNRPIRKPRPQFVREDWLRSIVRLALKEETQGVLVLFDADDECPRELAPKIQGWTQEEAGNVPCEVVIANREYEAWFLGALPSLPNLPQNVPVLLNPESVRGAKEKLRHLLGYTPMHHQASFSSRFDMAAAYRSCRSFRRMVSAFGRLAARMGTPLTDWPPASWTQT